MMLSRFARFALATVALFAMGSLALAQQPVRQPSRKPVAPVTAPLPQPSEVVPLDAAITVGRLENGLRYYIRKNSRPANRAELRLVVNAGSILEDDDQLGLAHVVEHMAFNGTKHFAGQEITAFMESIGMQFGPSMNAFTNFDDTTYALQVPTDRKEVLEKAFLIMEDWARNLTFDPKEVDKERGVIVEEWRLNRGAGARIQDKVFPVLLAGSRYATRSPIGTKGSIESFSHDRLKQFYRDWYRPDLMAVVAVGDFDPAAIEHLVKERFGPIPKPAVPRLRPTYAVPDHPGTRYAIVTDPEMPGAALGIFNMLPIRVQSTVLSYRERIVDHLYTAMLNARLGELSQKADPPFLGAGVNRGIFVRTKEAANLSAVMSPDKIAVALETLLTESARIAQHGFTATEFDREKKGLLRVYEQAMSEKDKDESPPLAAEYIRNFLLDESLPGIAWEYAMHQRFLPGITLAEVNALAREWTGDRDRVIVVSAPEKAGLSIATESQLASVVASVAAKPLAPYVDSAHATSLLAELPPAGSIVRETTIAEVGVTEWDLSNGVKVVLRPTTFKQDEVVFRATSPGGASLARDEDYVAAITASQVISAGGVGAFDVVGLNKVLAGKVASVTSIIDDTFEGLAGGGSARDLETILQLVYLYFTQPRADATAFGVMTSQLKTLLANRRATPEAVFEETVQTTLTQNHFRERPMSPELVSEMSLDKSIAFYKDRFSDASDFTFVFAGSFDVDAMRPLVTRYLGSLPSTRRQETWKDAGVRPPRGVVEKTIQKGLEPRSRVRIVFSGPFRWDPTDREALRVLGLVLEGQLGAALREDQSGTYGVKVTTLNQKVPTPQYSLSIDFSCAPERTEELVRRLFLEIARLRMDSLSESYVTDTREALMREYETSSKENRYLVEQISRSYQYSEDVRGILQIPAIDKRLSASMIQDAARLYLDTRNYVRVTLFPEKGR
jgi:zinc protease